MLIAANEIIISTRLTASHNSAWVRAMLQEQAGGTSSVAGSEASATHEAPFLTAWHPHATKPWL